MSRTKSQPQQQQSQPPPAKQHRHSHPPPKKLQSDRARENERTSPHSVNVLSIRQPYADLIILGLKWCENRTWTTNYRGPLYIHASSWEPTERDWYDDDDSVLGFRTGAIIGVVDLVDVIPVDVLNNCMLGYEPLDRYRETIAGLPNHREDAPPAECRSWDHVCGPECWILKNPAPLVKPIEAKGRLKVWRFDGIGSQFDELDMKG